jgi:beta-lactamase superfamily II metal-dependent hydrolase
MTARLGFVLLLVGLQVLPACSSGRRRPSRDRVTKIVEAPLRFVFLDLGQADAMLVVYRGKTLLMDAGESRTPEDSNKFHVIADRLEALTGKRHLDYFVLSHYHRDHVGDDRELTGLFGLIASDGVTVGTMIDRGPDNFGESGEKGETQQSYERAMPDWLKSGKVQNHRVVTIGEKVDLGEGLVIDVVAANGNGLIEDLAKNRPAELDAFPASENDYSVALKFTFGDFELFTGGDLTGLTQHREFGNRREGYHDIESSTAERVGDVEVYRANHHGSAHSTNACFIDVLNPEVSIISTGDNNYGHPTKQAYDLMASTGKVYITGGADQRVRAHVEKAIVGGDITVLVDGAGKRYSVNGRDLPAKSEEQEASQRPDRPLKCVGENTHTERRGGRGGRGAGGLGLRPSEASIDAGVAAPH